MQYLHLVKVDFHPFEKKTYIRLDEVFEIAYT